jgi:indolepyruvate ferredoxin oxidoreductase
MEVTPVDVRESTLTPRASYAGATLDDKYTKVSGRIYISGVQALVRLPLVQRLRDAAEGLNTGGFISGYRGSPLALYDEALWKAQGHLDAHHVNEIADTRDSPGEGK